MLPERFATEEELDAFLAEPSDALVDAMRRLDGDIALLGAGGKMGHTFARMAAAACRRAGGERAIWAVSRFGDAEARRRVEACGARALSCDLLDPKAVAALPDAPNVVYLAGRKFGTAGDAGQTWAANVVAPALVARRYAGSRIVALSTGCVYPLAPVAGSGCVESDAVGPIGEYAQSCLGRERIFEACARAPAAVCLIRLNYAIDMRYGVLHDIGRKVLAGEPVDLSMGWFQCIWQGDACDWTLRALEHAGAPAAVLNVTGAERLRVRDVARALAQRLGREARFCGEEGPTAYLSDAARAAGLFGAPRVGFEKLLDWTAQWLLAGGRSLGLPTHFETRDGRY